MGAVLSTNSHGMGSYLYEEIYLLVADAETNSILSPI
jgi:hypothetical protein